MSVLAAGLATLLAGALVLVVPIVGQRRYRRLVAEVGNDPDARLRHYRRGVQRAWAAVALVGVIGLLSGRSFTVGLVTHGFDSSGNSFNSGSSSSTGRWGPCSSSIDSTRRSTAASGSPITRST